MSLKHCEKTRECWKHTGKQTPGFSLLWLLWTRPKALGWEQPGFHWARIMERSALPLFYSSSYFFLRIKCHSAAHTSWPEARCATAVGDCTNSVSSCPWDLGWSPHFQAIWEPLKSSQASHCWRLLLLKSFMNIHDEWIFNSHS